jgi:hypothetical protein
MKLNLALSEIHKTINHPSIHLLMQSMNENVLKFDGIVFKIKEGYCVYLSSNSSIPINGPRNLNNIISAHSSYQLAHSQ